MLFKYMHQWDWGVPAREKKTMKTRFDSVSIQRVQNLRNLSEILRVHNCKLGSKPLYSVQFLISHLIARTSIHIVSRCQFHLAKLI